MQTAAAWTRAKFSCKLGNSLRRVHFGSVQLISNSKYLSVRTFDTVSPVNIFFFYVHTGLNVHVPIATLCKIVLGFYYTQG